MVKGCQKRTVYIKDTGSRMYEEAYFVLRPGAAERGIAESDMIKEALRIVKEGAATGTPGKKKEGGAFYPFVAGFAIGAAATLITALILL